MNPNELNIVKNEALIDEQLLIEVAERLETEYQSHKAQYDGFQASRESAEITGSSVRRAALWVIGSIKTDTRLVDSGADDILSGDFRTDKSFLTDTEDGELKWEKYGDWFSSQIPDRVAELLENGRVDDAHALLAGRDPETGSKVGEYYLRTNKASLVLYLLGYDRICVDTRIYRALKPAFRATLRNKPVGHPQSADPIVGKPSPNPYRSRAPRQDAKKVPVLTHSGDPEWDGEKSYWEDKLKWNPIQYDALTTHVRDELAKRCDVPKELIAQVAFNTQGDTTTHDGLMANL